MVFQRNRIGSLLAASLAALCVAGAPANAEPLQAALARAYSVNPELNAERARLRVIDENVPQALGAYRPQIFGEADAGIQTTRAYGTGGSTLPGVGGGGGGGNSSETTYPRGVGVVVQQDIFTGFGRSNALRQAEATVAAGRQTLRNVEQNVLLSAVEAYMNVLRDRALVRLNANNVEFLEEERRAAGDRFDVGEVTRTDVAQADAALGGARSQLSLARANLAASRATYRQVIGTEPENLSPASPVDQLVPASLSQAVELSRAQHPAILSANLFADAAQYAVNVSESDLWPTVSVEGSLSRRYDSGQADYVDSASIIGRVSVPIYQGGIVASQVRQSKEELGQRRIEVDLAREQVQAAVVSAWGGLESARAQIEASLAEVDASEIAVEGVREEASVGQRTTLDILEAQQNLIDAQVRLTTAQRDRVVASYSLISAVGRLNADELQLAAREYEPAQHYEQVRDKWHGLRTPAGN